MPFLKTLQVTVPPREVQETIVNSIKARSARDSAILARTSASIDRLKEYRSALITSAVTGQIDVTKWDKAGTTDRQLEKIQAEMGA